MKVEIPDTFETFARGIKGTFDFRKVPADKVADVLKYLIGYGINQSGQDAGASETKAAHEGNEEKARKAAASKAADRWAALMSGKVPEGGGMRAADPRASTLVAMLRSPAIRKAASTAYEGASVPKASDGFDGAHAFAKAHFSAKRLAAIMAAID